MIFFSGGNMILFAIWMACAFPVIKIAWLSNQPLFKWGAIGLIFGPLALVAACMMKNKTGKMQVEK